MKLTHIIESKLLPDFLYHGSNHDFESFDKRKQGSSSDPGMRGHGFYFTDNIKTAKGYGKFVYTVRLDIKNPFIPSECRSIDDFIHKLGLENDVEEWGLSSYIPSVFRFDADNGNLRVALPMAGRFTEMVRDAGFDGLIYYPATEYIVYEPSQITILDKIEVD